jgi:CheY-like chemotaxis protein
MPQGGSAVRCLQAALSAAWRGSGLTEQLLAFSRREEIRPELVSVDELLRDIVLLCQKAVGEGIEIVLRPQPMLWRCRIDPGQLEAVLLNLAANARDAMNGSGRLTIAADNLVIGARDDVELAAGEYVMVAVSDTGCGMTREVMARAFEPFYTTKGPGKGTGLGLSQVYGFSRQCGGTARIESKIGKGTTVRIYLPRAEGETSELRSLNDLSRASHAPDGTAAILIVEDHDDVRQTITEVLSHLGYRVLTATTGAEALAVLRQEKLIEVLLSDVVLPGGLSGIELARAARQLKPGLKVVLSSGYVGDEVRDDLVPGEFCFLPKPYRPAELAAKLTEVLSSDNVSL